VAFSLTAPGRASLQVYDVTGRLVRTVADENLPAGTHVRAWDGRDETGRDAGAGIYLVKLVTDKKRDAKKLARVP
jgi:flagellar hook assembly protein FlgD